MSDFCIQGSFGKPITFSIDYPSKSRRSPLIIFLHGFKGFKDWGQWPLLSKEFANKGFAVLRMNFSHNGTTPESPFDFVDLDAFGDNTFSKEAQDVKDVLDWVSSNKEIAMQIDHDNIFITAHSRGGAIALISLNEDPRIKSIATLSGVGTLVRFSEEELAHWKKQGTAYLLNGRTNQQMPMKYTLAEDYLSNKHRFDLHEVVPKIKKPFLLVHAQNDETVLLPEAEKLKSLNKNARLKVIENANHSFGGAHPYNESTLPIDTQKAVNFVSEFFKGLM